MNRFMPVLKNISENLDLPQPRKSQVLLEVAADLDDTFNYHLNRGLNEQQAQKEAEQKFSLSKEAVNDLANIHQPRFRKFFLSLSPKAQVLLERTSLIIMICLIVTISALFLANAGSIRSAGVFIWPIVTACITALAVFLVKFYSLFIRKEHFLKYINEWITPIAALGIISFFFSICGYFINLYKLTTESFVMASNPLLIIILNTSNPAHHEIIEGLAVWANQSLVILLCGIASFVLCALMWFILYNKAFKIAQSEISVIFKN